MTDSRRFAATTIALGLAALAHAAVTWPPEATVALFCGGAIIAFLAEAIVIHRGLLEHHVDPAIIGVPVYVLFGWTGTIYVAVRIALLATEGWPAVLVAAALATGYDLLTDHYGVVEGYWTYTDDLPGPRFRRVPWWNYVGWFVISALTATVALAFR